MPAQPGIGCKGKTNGIEPKLQGYGLEIRFAGDTADTATLNDKWEIECFGKTESLDDAGMPYSIKMTRR